MNKWLIAFACLLGISFSMSISSAQEEPPVGNTANEPEPVIMSDDEAESLAERIERTLLANVAVGAEDLAGEYRYFGTVSGNFTDTGPVQLPYSATLTDDGRFGIMIGLWDISEEIFEDPVPSSFQTNIISYQRLTLLNDVELEGIEIASADLEIYIAEVADDLMVGLDAGGRIYAWGNHQLDSSPELRSTNIAGKLFYNVAATLMWAPNETARVKLSTGYQQDGYDTEVTYRDPELNTSSGRMDFSTVYAKLSADPGWTVFGRATELNARYNFNTDMELKVRDMENGEQVIYSNDARPALSVWLSVKTRR